MLQAGVRKATRDVVENTAKGIATREQRDIARNAMKATMATRGGTAGAVVSGAPQSYGEAYGETVVSGNPNAGAALAAGTATLGLDVLPQAYAVKTATDVLKADKRAGG